MISLDIQDYCHNCRDFEPRCTKIYADNICVDTLVQCERKEVCSTIKTYIEQQITRKEDE